MSGLGFRKEFSEELEDVIDREVIKRITEAVANKFALPERDMSSVGDLLLEMLEEKNAGELVLHLVKYMIDRKLLAYCHEDRVLWLGQEWSGFEVKFDEEMDNCG